MSYSNDVRRLVKQHVAGGGSKSEVARIYGVSRGTVYLWLGLGAKKLKGTKPGPKRNRKVDAAALPAQVKVCPDIRLAELGAQFGVHESTISYAFKRAGMTRKKTFRYFQGICKNADKRKRYLKHGYRHHAAGKRHTHPTSCLSKKPSVCSSDADNTTITSPSISVCVIIYSSEYRHPVR